MLAYYEAVAQLPQPYNALLSNVSEEVAREVTEVRIRKNRPIVLTLRQGFCFASANKITCQDVRDALITNADAVERCFLALCGYSVYSMEGCIAEGYIPVADGHRAGICGSAYIRANGEMGVKDISAINLRIARTDLVQCDPRLAQLLLAQHIGVLIAGAPSSGKTTVLRGVIKALSDAGRRVAVVDERRELCEGAGAIHLDVLLGYPKAKGMLQAIRSLSPEILVCDEVGGEDDANAILCALNAGVGIVMSAHAESVAGLYRRPQSKAILQTGAISHICLLKGSDCPTCIERIVAIDAIS